MKASVLSFHALQTHLLNLSNEIGPKRVFGGDTILVYLYGKSSIYYTMSEDAVQASLESNQIDIIERL